MLKLFSQIVKHQYMPWQYTLVYLKLFPDNSKFYITQTIVGEKSDIGTYKNTNN